MSHERKLQVSGTIEAPADQIFALLADPARHPELDGAGMVQASTPDRAPSRVAATPS